MDGGESVVRAHNIPSTDEQTDGWGGTERKEGYDPLLPMVLWLGSTIQSEDDFEQTCGRNDEGREQHDILYDCNE